MSTSDATLAPAAPRSRPLVDSQLLVWLAWTSGLVPLALLVWDALHDDLGANAVNHAIHTTGLVGLVMLLLTLLVTPVRKLSGWQTIIAVRRPLGLLSFVYLMTHLTIFFVWDREASVASTVTEILTRTYLQLGFIALALMSLLALTSTDGWARRLGKRWKWLHRLIYPIAILGVTHFLLLVKSDLRLPRALAIVLGVLLLYRVVAHYVELSRAAHKRLPVAASPTRKRFWSGELEVMRIFQETHDVKTFRLRAPGGGPLPFLSEAGQYLNLTLMIDGKRVSRSYTIASAPSDIYCELTVKRTPTGYASHHLHERVREGDRLKIGAPAGRFVFDATTSERVLLIAGGVGITPLMAIVRDLTNRCWPGRIDFLVAMRTPADLVFEAELGELTRRFPNLHLHVTLSDPTDTWSGRRGRIDRALLAEVLALAEGAPIFLCGPEPMMDTVRAELVGLGVPAGRIATEAFVSPPAGSDAPVELPQGEAVQAQATFTRRGQTITVAPGSTLLEAAEQSGIALPFECRSGICGQCKIMLCKGNVSMAVQDALSKSDREHGIILACQAHPTSDIQLDA